MAYLSLKVGGGPFELESGARFKLEWVALYHRNLQQTKRVGQIQSFHKMIFPNRIKNSAILNFWKMTPVELKMYFDPNLPPSKFELYP